MHAEPNKVKPLERQVPLHDRVRLLRFGASPNASQAASVANFSSWVQGEPCPRPNSVTMRRSASGLR